MLEKKMSITDLQAKKGVEKITAITAYDALMAEIFDAEVGSLALVGRMRHWGRVWKKCSIIQRRFAGA